MKKIIGIIAIVLVSFTIGYFVGDASAINRVNSNWDQIVAEKELASLINDETEGDNPGKKEDSNQQDEIPMLFDEIAPTIKILEPNSIGTVYMEATYINNSKYPITGYSAKILLKDKNETVYLSTHDTVMPGETSPNFDCFGPDTQSESDYEILTLEVTARKEDGNNLYIDYDLKLKEASWWESTN